VGLASRGIPFLAAEAELSASRSSRTAVPRQREHSYILQQEQARARSFSIGGDAGERTVEQTKAMGERLGTQEREQLLRAYASGRISWGELGQRGFADYVEVLAGLGEIGLRPPMAPMEGPSLSVRERGRALLRRLLREAAQS
jgi:hypothetical protein